MVETARFVKKSLTIFHCAGEDVISVVFHKPPSMPPTKTVLLVGSERSVQIARILPLVIPLLGLLLPFVGPTMSANGPLSI